MLARAARRRASGQPWGKLISKKGYFAQKMLFF
jgi:hypothetical protein